MCKPIYLWKSLKKGLVSRHNDFKWRKDKWYSTSGTLKMCETGFHASENIIDAMRYVACGNLAKVEVSGKLLEQEDKQCWEKMRVVKYYNWTKEDSVRLAIYAASLVINIYEKEYPNDNRVRNAIETKERWITEKIRLGVL